MAEGKVVVKAKSVKPIRQCDGAHMGLPVHLTEMNPSKCIVRV